MPASPIYAASLCLVLVEVLQMADLLNCPFCGGEAEIKRQGTPRVSMLYACTECGCELETGETGTAYLMWNRRVAQQEQPLSDLQRLGQEFDAAQATSGYMQAPVEPSPIVSPHSEGVFPKPGTEFVGIDDLTPHAFIDHNRLKGLARNCRNEGNRNSQQAAYHQLLDEIDRLPSTPPVTEQVQPVAVTTHGQLDLIRRDDSGKMFPLDGYLHRSVEAIPLFTSPSDQSALLAEAAEVLEPFAKAADIRLCGEWPDDGRIARTDAANHLTFGHMRRARSLLAKLREVQ
jgi:predicted RNA-binding Zn-ribbon protein involved in translation (DUF1610 family)